MSDTTYIDYVTPAVNAEWLNEINDHVWHDTPVMGVTVHDASVIKNTPAGTIASTNIQDAINELDADKLAVGGPATSVTNTPAGDIIATNVQAAINELDSEKIGYTRLDDSDGSDLVGFIQSGTGAVLRTSQDKLREYVSVKDFGAVGDGVTDDTAAIQAAITACPVGMWIDGSGLTYKIVTTVSASGETFNLRNAKFVTTSTYDSQGAFLITSLNVNLENIEVDGGRDTYKTGSETWSAFTTLFSTTSIEPALANFFEIVNFDANARTRIVNCNFKNVFALSCVNVQTYGTVYIDNCDFRNIANKTFHVYHSPDDGVTQAGRTMVSNVYAENVGILPSSYLVDGVSHVRADAFAPQGSFNFIVSHGDYSLTNAVVYNYGSCGVTADRNRSFTSTGVSIFHDSPYGFSNNSSGALWLENCIHSNVSDLFISVTDRDAREIPWDSCLLQIFATAGTQTNISNVVLITSAAVAKVNKIIRGSLTGNPFILIDNFYLYGLATTYDNVITFGLLSDSAIGHDVRITNGFVRHGGVRCESPYSLTIDGVHLFGESLAGSISIPATGAAGVIGSVGNISISDSYVGGSIISTVDVTGSINVKNNRNIIGSITCAASSGQHIVSGNAKIGGSIVLSGTSATAGTCVVTDNAQISGLTIITAGKSARVSGNGTYRRIEVKDVQVFEIVGNTARTDQGEPIIMINPVTAANVLAGVISSNNILIKAGTVSAGYVSVTAGTGTVLDVNNNKLTVAWS